MARVLVNWLTDDPSFLYDERTWMGTLGFRLSINGDNLPGFVISGPDDLTINLRSNRVVRYRLITKDSLETLT